MMTSRSQFAAVGLTTVLSASVFSPSIASASTAGARRLQDQIAQLQSSVERTRTALFVARRVSLDAAPPPRRLRARVARGARGYICPVAGPVRFTDDFGEPRPTGRHTGVDMHADIGIPVVAIFAGRIERLPSGYEDSGYGNLQILRDT